MLQCVHVDLIKYFAMDFYLLPVVPVQTDSTYTETHLLKNYFFTVRTLVHVCQYSPVLLGDGSRIPSDYYSHYLFYH